jgi:transposase
LNEKETEWLVSRFRQNKRFTIREAREYFGHLYSDMAIPSAGTVSKILHDNHVRYKVIQSLMKKADPKSQLEYLEFMGSIESHHIIDIDGIVQNASEFMIKYGWVPDDDDGVEYQINIGDRTFAVMAAYTEKGFLAWMIFESTVTENEVESFLDYLDDLVHRDSFGILDNAKHQKTERVVAKLEELFGGRYRNSPAYSPIFKPIERGFSNVKTRIRRTAFENPDMDPYDIIMEAFTYYSCQGEGASAG